MSLESNISDLNLSTSGLLVAINTQKAALDTAVANASQAAAKASAVALASLADSGGAGLVGYMPTGTGAVARTVQGKLRESMSTKDFGAVGDGVTDDTAALTAMFAAAGGTVVDGQGKKYKVVGNTVIDSSATAGVGYGLGKAWFLAGACRNINFVGNVSFGADGAYFLPKGSQLENVFVTGDARFSGWYSSFRGFVVTGNTYFGGDFPPSTNWNGFYYNTFTGCNFNTVIVDQRYGPVNVNTFNECRFTNYHIVYTGNTGYGSGTLPIQSHHMNRYINCEWFDSVGITAPDGNKYVMVADANTILGGGNMFDGVYNESTIMGFYLLGAEVRNIHFSGNQQPTMGAGDIGYNIPYSGEGGWAAGEARDVPHITTSGNFAVGGDWSVLNSSGVPYCLVGSSMTITTGTDTQEPTGLSKYAQFASTATFARVEITFGAADLNNRTLRSFACVYKVIAGAPAWEVQDSAGAIVYGAAGITRLANGWLLAYGHTYGFARLNVGGAAGTVQISACSGGRGSGVVSPVTNQQGGKPLIDLSNGPSIVDDFITGNTKVVNYRTNMKSIQTSSGTVSWFSVNLGAFTGTPIHIKAVYGLSSGGGGARTWYRESIVNENGGGALTEQNLHVLSGSNGTLSFSLSGAVLTVTSTSTVASTETAKMAIEVMGYGINSSNITTL